MKKAMLLLIVLLAAGCSSKPATVKGALALNGKPFPLPKDAGIVFVLFRGLGADGQPDLMKMYSAKVEPDGSFEVVSSTGQLPAGTYQWAIDATSTSVKEFEPFTSAKSKARIELVPGPNQLTLDLKSP